MKHFGLISQPRSRSGSRLINKLKPSLNLGCEIGPLSFLDESSFKMFAVYCALALHYSKASIK